MRKSSTENSLLGFSVCDVSAQ